MAIVIIGSRMLNGGAKIFVYVEIIFFAGSGFAMIYLSWLNSWRNKHGIDVVRKDVINAFAEIHLPTCITSNDGKIIYVNNAFSEWLSISPNCLNGSEFMDLFIEPPKSWDELRTEIFYIKNVKNKPVPASVSYVVSLPRVDLVCFVMMNMDVTLSLKKLGDPGVLEMLPISAAFIDENGGIKCMNKILRSRLKISDDGYIPISTWIAEKDKVFLIKTLKSIRKKTDIPEPISIHTKNNDGKGILAFFKYFHSYDGQSPGQFLVIFDEFMEDRLLSSRDSNPEKMQLLGQLSSGIVHDFNNLLTGIMGFCDLLLQKHSEEDASFKDIMQIKQSSMRAARLIQQLLAFSKSSIPAMEVVDIKTCLQELSPLIRRMIGPKILLIITQKTPIKHAYGDKGQIEQILLNLAINARDSMMCGGSLTFSLKTIFAKSSVHVANGKINPGNYIVIEVTDSGTGIPDEHIARIFDPFFSTKDPGQGTGLGLANVLQIMEALSGGICVKTKIGKGTTFSLYFPEHEAKSGSQVVEIPETKHENPVVLSKILLVDDEDAVRLFASRALKAKGHDVIEARDGHHAVHLLSEHNDISIIVSDVMMPGVDGPSLAEIVRKKHPNIKILFVSGYPEDEVRTQLPPDSKDIYFLQKPFALCALVDEVHKISSVTKETQQDVTKTL